MLARNGLGFWVVGTCIDGIWWARPAILLVRVRDCGRPRRNVTGRPTPPARGTCCATFRSVSWLLDLTPLPRLPPIDSKWQMWVASQLQWRGPRRIFTDFPMFHLSSEWNTRMDGWSCGRTRWAGMPRLKRCQPKRCSLGVFCGIYGELFSGREGWEVRACHN